MTDSKALVLNFDVGQLQQIAADGYLVVGSGIKSSGSGSLAVAAGSNNAGSGGDVILNAGAGSSNNGSILLGSTTTLIVSVQAPLTVTAGHTTNLLGNVVLGTNNSNSVTLNGTTTINSTTSINGITTIQAGASLTTSGTGNINLPNNVNARFQIESVAVTASVTASNLTTLTNGSNADALHVHSFGGVSVVSGAAIAVGAPIGIENVAGSPRAFASISTASSNRHNVMGFATTSAGASGVTVSLSVQGEITIPDAQWAGSLPGVADVGKIVYLSSVAGKSTLTPPSLATNYLQKIGLVTSAPGSNNTKIVIQIGDSILL